MRPIKLLEQPFQKGHNTFDDVSLFLLTEFAERLGDRERRIDSGGDFGPLRIPLVR